jgi:hypothetical protein
MKVKYLQQGEHMNSDIDPTKYEMQKTNRAFFSSGNQ